jgi:hypothetical protein
MLIKVKVKEIYAGPGTLVNGVSHSLSHVPVYMAEHSPITGYLYSRRQFKVIRHNFYKY